MIRAQAVITAGSHHEDPTLLAALGAAAALVSMPAQAYLFSAVYSFGDSLSDTGSSGLMNNRPALPPDPPYADGRYSNGPVAAEYLALRRGVPLYSYAVGGALSGEGNADVVDPLDTAYNSGVTKQVEQFLNDVVGNADSSALYMLLGGSNDLLSLLAANNSPDATAIDAVATEIINNLTGAVFCRQLAGAPDRPIAPPPSKPRSSPGGATCTSTPSSATASSAPRHRGRAPARWAWTRCAPAWRTPAWWGLLKGALPGPVVALRADMDGLPVTEEVDLPFVQGPRGEWNGEEVGVMHACGHDCHVAILMGVAQVLAGLRAQLRGSVKFIFQPAEEMPPAGEDGGAKMMVAEGALEKPVPQAIFGLHVTSRQNVGQVGYRPGPAMASADQLKITVHGRQTHGAAPWLGVDPIVTAAQVVLGLQTVVSRGIDITEEPAVVSLGAIRGGVRDNIIPDSVEMRGTIRTFNEGHARRHPRARDHAGRAVSRGSRAGCTVCITKNYPVTINDPALTEAMLPTLQRVAGPGGLQLVPKVTGSEDFSFFQRVVPGLFVFLGITPAGLDPKKAAPNHSPRFCARWRTCRRERGLLLGRAHRWRTWQLRLPRDADATIVE
jgi:amidohydrolase